MSSSNSNTTGIHGLRDIFDIPDNNLLEGFEIPHEDVLAFGLEQAKEDQLDDIFNIFVGDQGTAAFVGEPAGQALPEAQIPSSPPTITIIQEPYHPIIALWEPAPASSSSPTRPPQPPIYPAYTHTFTNSAAARSHRKRPRLPPQNPLAQDLHRVKTLGRPFWTKRIYEAMISETDISDSPQSTHRTRFTKTHVFDPLDIEASAHHVFDAVLAAHERGWCRSSVYRKKVVRAKLKDDACEQSVELKLEAVCECLRGSKAAVDDVLRGGVTLALVVDNPRARGATKGTNNAGNKKRGERLRRVREMERQEKDGDQQEDQGQQQDQGQRQQETVVEQDQEHGQQQQEPVGYEERDAGSDE